MKAPTLNNAATPGPASGGGGHGRERWRRLAPPILLYLYKHK